MLWAAGRSLSTWVTTQNESRCNGGELVGKGEIPFQNKEQGTRMLEPSSQNLVNFASISHKAPP